MCVILNERKAAHFIGSLNTFPPKTWPKITTTMCFDLKYAEQSLSPFPSSRAKLPPAEHLNCIVMGKKYTGEEALRAGIVSHVCPATEIMDAAMKMAESAAKENYDGPALTMLKHNLYNGEHTTLCGPLLYSKL